MSRERGREGGRKGEREGGREKGREKGREGESSLPSLHTPCPVQLLTEQFTSSHASPVHARSHEQTPLSHDPCLLQSGSRHCTSCTHTTVETFLGHLYRAAKSLGEREKQVKQVSGGRYIQPVTVVINHVL